MRISALIVAAGRGIRLGAGKNKLLVEIGKKTILDYTVEVFEQAALIDDIVIVAAEEDLREVELVANKYHKDIRIVQGAETRTQSVHNGLKAIDPSCEIVLIHDGARPFVTENNIKYCIDDVRLHGSAITAVPVTDTIKRADESFMVTETLDRTDLYSVQTPQGFLYRDILGAYNKLAEGENFSDDSAVYEKYVGKPYICIGSAGNIKITYSEDLRSFFKEEEMFKCGTGYDSHRFAAGRKLVLGGVDIPAPYGLEGHSDADALIHAVIDSMLTAAGAADIGTYFPDTMPEYKDIDSLKLLKRTFDIITAKGFKVSNLSCAVLCQGVRLADHIPQMKQNIAHCLSIDVSDVGISAKTNEKMGFVGREEGIAVISNCLLKI